MIFLAIILPSILNVEDSIVTVPFGAYETLTFILHSGVIYPLIDDRNPFRVHGATSVFVPPNSGPYGISATSA